MTERLLHFIWQFQHFAKGELTTEQHEQLEILHQGTYNSNQGPDFSNASIKIDDTQWAGNIELHINSSDWYKHNHSSDSNFSNIILHVVWVHDEEIKDINNFILPTLCLQSRVPKVLLEKFNGLMQSKAFVPSQQHLPGLSALAWSAWKERLAVERLQRKSNIILMLFAKTNNHWEEVFWRMIARNFGMKVNADIFENIASILSINLIAKHKNQIHQLEALLLGLANLLDKEFDEDYPKLLQREYKFLKTKYRLQAMDQTPYFLRMRPANFPTIRLAQLAMLINQSTALFSKIKETETLSSLKELLNVKANDYWHYHYKFDELTDFKPKIVGKQMIDNIIINTVVPILFAYGSRLKDEKYKLKALQWLAELTPEKNNITLQWQQHGVTNANALESQALIELKNNYCNEKRCLECAVGNAILKQKDLA